MVDFRVVFVGGMGRSGSTLLERLLGELPEACSLGEVVHLWQRGLVDNERCGCGCPFYECPFWRAVGVRAFGGWDQLEPTQVLALRGSVDRTRFVPRLLRGQLAAEQHARLLRYVELYHRLYAAVAAQTGCSIVVDSSKHASLAACLRWGLPAELRIVHVVRDPRAVADAWLKHRLRPEATATSPEQVMARTNPARTAVHWSAQNLAFSGLAARGIPTRQVRYEVDSSKHASLAACLRWGLPAELRIVHVVRDPRAVADAWLKHRLRPEATATSPEQVMARTNPARTAVHWSAQNLAFSGLAARGIPTRQVRYEDFAAQPQQELQSLARFVGCTDVHGAEWPFSGTTTARLAPAHTVSGNPARFGAGEVPVRFDESWRERLGWRHRLLVSALTAPVRNRYGY